MAVFLLKLIFHILSALSNLATWLVFTTAAHVVVQIIQVIKVPGESSRRILDHVKNFISAFLDYLMGLMMEAITSFISAFFDFVKEGVFSSSSGLAAGVAGLLEKSKTSLEDAFNDIPQVLEAFTEMVGKIVTDFLKNCNEALAYVAENVFR